MKPVPLSRAVSPAALSRFALRLLAMATLAPLAFAAAQDVSTAHNDIARDGVQAAESILTPANVNVRDFGKLFSFPVLGDVYAQPLYLHQFKMGDGKLHNVLLVATAQDGVFTGGSGGLTAIQDIVDWVYAVNQ